MTTQEAIQNIEAFAQQALGAGLFKDFNTAALMQQSILIIKKELTDGNKKKGSSAKEKSS
jgi:hypothetical protein